jgi:hypothetical protein
VTTGILFYLNKKAEFKQKLKLERLHDSGDAVHTVVSCAA